MTASTRRHVSSLLLSDNPSGSEIGTLLAAVPSVDAVSVAERVGYLGSRSIKQSAKRVALDLVVRMIDLTTLEGKDTPAKVRQLAAKAIRPDPLDSSVPPVAALCIYPTMVSVAKAALEGTGMNIASVATYFPSGLAELDLKLTEVHKAITAGANEIDMVINRGAFLAGDYKMVYDEIRAVKEVCGPVHLKVILETGELGTLDAVRQASLLAMAAGGDFIKTSTGTIPAAANRVVSLVMLEAIREFHQLTGLMVGMKPAGGIRTSKEALKYLVLVNETLGSRWLTPELFRFGASSLLNDVLMQFRWMSTGRYQSADYFTKD